MSPWSSTLDATFTEAPSLEIGETPRDHRIPLQEGVAMVRRYRERHPDAIHASMFDRAIFDQLLAQPGCAGVRMYYAEAANGAQTLVLVGVDAQGNDLWDGDIGDTHFPCPPFCSDHGPFMP
jgi:hypothetical protein